METQYYSSQYHPITFPQFLQFSSVPITNLSPKLHNHIFFCQRRSVIWARDTCYSDQTSERRRTHGNVVTRRITTFRSTTDRIYDGGPIIIQCVPLVTEPGISLIILPLIRILQRNLRRTSDTFLFISHTTNVLLFKFRCNIFIGVRIIKEMPGSVASGTHCIIL